MTSKLDLSLDEIIVREGITSNRPKRTQLNNSNNKLIDNKFGFKNITCKVNNNKTDLNGDQQQQNLLTESLKRKATTIDGNVVSKRANNEISLGTNSGLNNGYHFDNNCGAIFVNNLKYEVTDQDIQQLFGAFGDLRRAAVNYQSNGRSAGTAFVVFERECDAITAIGSLKNVTLDGRTLYLSIVNCNNGNQLSAAGPDSTEQVMGRRIANFTNRINASQSMSNSSNSSGGRRNLWNDIAKNYDSTFGSNEPRRNYRNQRFNNSVSDQSGSRDNVNIEDLDADLDSYIAKRNVSK